MTRVGVCRISALWVCHAACRNVHGVYLHISAGLGGAAGARVAAARPRAALQHVASSSTARAEGELSSGRLQHERSRRRRDGTWVVAGRWRTADRTRIFQLVPSVNYRISQGREHKRTHSGITSTKARMWMSCRVTLGRAPNPRFVGIARSADLSPDFFVATGSRRTASESRSTYIL